MTKEQLLVTKEGFRFTKEWEEYWQMNLHFFEKLSGREGDRKAPLFDAATVCICTLTKLYLLICISTQLYWCIWTWAGTLHNIAQDIAQSSNHKSNLAHMTLYQALKRTFQFLNLKIRPEKRIDNKYCVQGLRFHQMEIILNSWNRGLYQFWMNFAFIETD